MADGIMEGLFCQQCGDLNPCIEEGEEPPGFPWTCGGCRGEDEEYRAEQRALKKARLEEAKRRQVAAGKWAASVGLFLHVSQDGAHWQFRSRGFTAEWWPSTGKLVFDKQFRKAQRTHSTQHVKDQILQRIPK